MKNILSLISVSLTLLPSFYLSQFKIKEQKTYNSNKKVYVKKTKTAVNGIVYGDYKLNKNKKVYFELNYINGTQNGVSKFWDKKTGQILWEYSYLNGKFDGAHKKWEKGKLKHIQYYKNGNLYKSCFDFYNNNQPAYCKMYNNDNVVVKRLGWFQDGQQSYETIFKNGEEISVTKWLKNGCKMKTNFQTNKTLYWDADGNTCDGKEANFPGGEKKLYEYLNENINYPKIAKMLSEQGKVFVEFVVLEDGNIIDTKVIKGVSLELDNEAKRVVKNMPNWIPGQVCSNNIKQTYVLPISFKID